MPICPQGHESPTDDYCDVCGWPMRAPAARLAGPSGAGAPTAGAGSGAAGSGQPTTAVVHCPICSTAQTGRYCAECGYDYELAPRPRRPAEPPVPASPATSAPQDAPAPPGRPGYADRPVTPPHGASDRPGPGSDFLLPPPSGAGPDRPIRQAPAPFSPSGAPASAEPSEPRAVPQAGPAAPIVPPAAYSAPPRPAMPPSPAAPPPSPPAPPATPPTAPPAGGPHPGAGYSGAPGYGVQPPGPAGHASRPGYPPQPPYPATGSPAARTDWLAVVRADPEHFSATMARSGPEAQGLTFPQYAPERRVPLSGRGGRVRIGRRSHHRGTVPEIDLSTPPEDPGASHQHALLQEQPDGSWALIDQDSTNGTTLNGAPDPIPPHVPVPLKEGDRIHVGAWTTITLHRS